MKKLCKYTRIYIVCEALEKTASFNPKHAKLLLKIGHPLLERTIKLIEKLQIKKIKINTFYLSKRDQKICGSIKYKFRYPVN